MRPLILLMSLFCLNQAAKIKQIKVNPEVFKGEYIHLQCLVEYEEEDSKSELSIEFYRSTDQDQLEHLSSNGQLEVEVPSGQKYYAYVGDLESNTQEHAFRITNIDFKDSGNYSCHIRKNQDLVDFKKRMVQVQEEEEYDYADFASKFQDFQPLVTKDQVEQKSDKQINNELKCGEKRLYKTKDIEDLSVPIVCFPEAIDPHVVQKPGETAALPCIAESHPPAKVSFYRIRNDTMEELHSRGKTSMEIAEFGNNSQTVLLKIHEVSEDDYGDYVCVATNANDDKQHDELLITLAKPTDFSSASSISNLYAFSILSNLVICLLFK